ncbi:MAG TPA: Hpt domain-containing protein [Polyangiales bacterium]|nr:Hpt domain-containing protein [Polyangiales bacterium]
MSEQMAMDWGLLERLCGDQHDFMRHLIALYIEDTRRDQSELEGAYARGELEAVERIAHRMRGAAKTIGAERVALSCHQLQFALKGNEHGHGARELTLLGRELEALFALLAGHMDTLDGAR